MIYDALLLPIYGLWPSDGLTFKIHVDRPNLHGEPETMIQADNENVEAITRENTDQWF
ncbi:MAG: hypothetical protein KJN60_06965 [Boseongicola sp.]|nr:hypothetical protein [Boseongicola sp.]